jgi:hypothetical protein
MGNEIYDPLKPVLDYAKTQMDKVDSPEYLFRYWKSLGKFPNSGPHIESMPDWDSLEE